MNHIYEIDNEDFDIYKILESGQNSKFIKDKNIYQLCINDIKVEIETIGTKTYFNIDEEFFKKYLYDYFDMGTDYGKIRKEINIRFPELKVYTEQGKGIRFIKQPFIEAATATIISQNNNIRNITSATDKLVNIYGDKGKFPSLKKLKTITKEELNALSIGYRDEYLYLFFQNIDEKQIEDLYKMNTQDAFNTLTNFKGIGPKVTNCILLFGLDKRDVFPVDVHIKRIMEKIYFKEETKTPKQIESFAINKYGEYASYIQQYLFFSCIKK